MPYEKTINAAQAKARVSTIAREDVAHDAAPALPANLSNSNLTPAAITASQTWAGMATTISAPASSQLLSPMAESRSALLPPRARNTDISAAVHHQNMTVLFTLGLVVMLLLLIFPVLLPSFALMIASAGGCAYKFGHVGRWEAVIVLALAVNLALLPGAVKLLAAFFAWSLVGKLGGWYPAEGPQKVSIRRYAASARLRGVQLISTIDEEDGNEEGSPEWRDAHGMLLAEELSTPPRDIGELPITGGDGHDEELEG